MRIDKKKAFTLFALTLLIASLVFINMNGPTGATSPSEASGSAPAGIVPPLTYLHGPRLTPVHMHGPPLTPIHMHSNMTLTPIHMHHLGGLMQWDDPRLEEPICTDWHELYPETCTMWHLSSWNDTGEPFGQLSPNDQIDMTDAEGNVTWYHVDRMTVTLLLSGPYEVPPPHEPAAPTMAIELKWPKYFPEIKYDYNLPPYLISTWHEVWPNYSKVYNLTSWTDDPFNPPGGDHKLGFTDVIDLTDIVTGLTTWWHVEEISTDIILREKIMDPKCTWWHELYPDYSKWYHLTSWESYPDEYCDRLSPSDQIDMVEEGTENKTWYHVDRVTLTINVTDTLTEEWMMLELKTEFFEEMYEALKEPLYTFWHEVYPNYSRVYQLVWWDPMNPAFDNCNGVLDPCDYILLNTTGKTLYCHIEDMCYDIILNKKITDPRCTNWTEVYPEYDPPLVVKEFHLNSWEDVDDDKRLSPYDQIDMNDTETGEISWWHVDRVTLTLNVTIVIDGPEYYLFEYKGPFEDMYRVKTDPICTRWHSVWPYYSEIVHLENWTDNCNGVLDRCDLIKLSGVWCHVEGLYIDIILNKKITDPVCTDWWEHYPDLGNWYHLEGWEDNDDGVLSPCDQVNLTLQPGGPTKEYHVENVTLSLNTTLDGVCCYYFEYTGPFEGMYRVKTEPIGTTWTQWAFPGGSFQLENWTDNCNGVLDRCDLIYMAGNWFHVEDVAIDMVVRQKVHDVAVIDVESKYPWVYQGDIDPIDVNVTNLGDFNEPTVTVYAFYDGNLAAPPQTTSLNIGETKTLTFNWDTTTVPIGFYTVRANATIPVDDDLTNNILSGNVQEVRERPTPPPLPVTADLELYPRMVYDVKNPIGYQWHELYPNRTMFYQVLDWHPGMVLSPEDLVVMGETTFIVDDVTIDIEVIDENGTLYWLDYECGYWTFDPKEPVCTKWNEIKNTLTHEPPIPPRCWHLTDWSDDSGDGRLSDGDSILMTPNNPFPGLPTVFTVGLVTVTLKLTEYEAPAPVQHYLEFAGTLEEFQANDYIHNPLMTAWVEIWPNQGSSYELVDWLDQLFLSPSDQILLTLKDPDTHEPIPGAEAWYHVDKLTVAMNLTSMYTGMEHIVKFEGSLRQFKQYHWTEPWGTQWHEVSPTYCTQWYLYDWYDSQPDDYLDYCDYILMVNKETGIEEEFHVESLSTDMWVTQKICGVDITNVTVTYCSAGAVMPEAYKTWTVNVKVTVHNNGTIPTNCTVNAYYYNATFTQQIGTSQNITNLDPCNTITVTFSWDCLSLPVGVTYTVKANATCPCGASDEFVNGPMTKRPWGDVNNNGGVDFGDFGKMKLIYSQVWPYPCPPFDVNRPETYYYLSSLKPPYLPEYLMPDLDGDCKVKFADVGKMKLIYSGALTEEDC